jgi:hypothetical protein
MAARRVSVRKIKEVLRLGAQGLSDREIGRSLRIAKNWSSPGSVDTPLLR